MHVCIHRYANARAAEAARRDQRMKRNDQRGSRWGCVANVARATGRLKKGTEGAAGAAGDASVSGAASTAGAPPPPGSQSQNGTMPPKGEAGTDGAQSDVAVDEGIDKVEFVVGMLVLLGVLDWEEATPVMKHFDQMDLSKRGRLYQVPLTPHPSPLTPHPSPLTFHPSHPSDL